MDESGEQLGSQYEDALLVAEHLHQINQHVAAVFALSNQRRKRRMAPDVEKNDQGDSTNEATLL